MENNTLKRSLVITLATFVLVFVSNLVWFWIKTGSVSGNILFSLGVSLTACILVLVIDKVFRK